MSNIIIRQITHELVTLSSGVVQSVSIPDGVRAVQIQERSGNKLVRMSFYNNVTGNGEAYWSLKGHPYYFNAEILALPTNETIYFLLDPAYQPSAYVEIIWFIG